VPERWFAELESVCGLKVHRGFKSHRHRQGVVTKLPRLKLRNPPLETGNGSWRGVSLRSGAAVVSLVGGGAGVLAGALSFGCLGAAVGAHRREGRRAAGAVCSGEVARGGSGCGRRAGGPDTAGGRVYLLERDRPDLHEGERVGDVTGRP
jgi:hypothetical protein